MCLISGPRVLTFNSFKKQLEIGICAGDHQRLLKGREELKTVRIAAINSNTNIKEEVEEAALASMTNPSFVSSTLIICRKQLFVDFEERCYWMGLGS